MVFQLNLKVIDQNIYNQLKKKDIWKYKNHKGAEEYPNEMSAYLEKESKNAAIIGPFKENPFTTGIKISPTCRCQRKKQMNGVCF